MGWVPAVVTSRTQPPRDRGEVVLHAAQVVAQRHGRGRAPLEQDYLVRELCRRAGAPMPDGPWDRLRRSERSALDRTAARLMPELQRELNPR
jgi:hypothetical protein